jgi:hypothetical protein
MRARILDTWEMELPDPTENPWFVDWVARSPKQAGDHLEVSWKTFLALALDQPEGFTTIREYFGGIGAHALMLEQLFSPVKHVVNEYSPEAVRHLESLGLDVQQSDAYNLDAAGVADLAVLDFGDLTAWKASQPDRAALLDLVFGLKPKAVTITDIAARYLHLQKKHYEPILGKGTCDTYEDYLQAFALHLQERYGYVLLEGNYTRWSCVMAFVPGDGYPQGDFHKHTSTAKGLVLV